MHRTTLIAWLGLCLLMSAGCSSVPLFSRSQFKEADARHPVVEVLCVWEPAEGRGLDNLPCRGFGGQVLFFSSGLAEPVKVEGDVRIYVFDDEGVDGDPSKPIHQFDFPGAAWNTFLKPSNLGASYQMFVPYTRKGMHGAACTLRVRFTPEGGLPVYSRLATVVLAGHASLDEKKSNKQIVTVSGESNEKGQGVVTADWSEIVQNAGAASPSTPSLTPGISLATHQQASRQANNLQTLRQAADEANQPAPSEPPRRLPAAASGLKLKPLHPLEPEFVAIDESGFSQENADSRPQRRVSPATTAPKRRHPLADVESE